MAMEYVSTRGKVKPALYCEAITAGFAPDGGLYLRLTADIPRFTKEEIARLRSGPPKYTDTVFSTTFPFVDGIPESTYRGFITRAFDPRKWGDDPTPLRDVGGIKILELFHGPSGAFKDLAMQPVGIELSHLMSTTAAGRIMTIIVATSGDTGPAAIEAFRDLPGIRLIVFFPKNGTSAFQRKQMTAAARGNVYVMAVDGSFDACQAIVKALGTRPDLVELLNISGVNSINWDRVKFQIPYYFQAHALAAASDERDVTIVVPSGNFGNAYAGFLARLMGLKVRIVVATNENKILTNVFQDGVYWPTESEIQTISPSMNITKASNFERLLYWLTDDDPDRVRAYMEEQRKTGAYRLERDHFVKLRESGLSADFASDAECLAAMHDVHRRHGYWLDPHTAVAWVVAQRLRHEATSIVVLSTAAPYKFGPAVHQAIGEYPERPDAFVGFEESADGSQVIQLSTDPDEAERVLRQIAKAA